MKKIIALILLTLSYNGIAQNVQEKYQNAKIYYNTTEDLIRLTELDIPIEHGIHKRNYFIISDFSVSELDKARQAGFQVDILIEDSKEHFLEQNRLNLPDTRNTDCSGSTQTYNTPANFNLGTMGGYLTYQELLDELDDMATLYPNLITTKADISTFLTEGTPDNSTTPSIGSNPIKWVKISDNPNNNSEGEPQVLYTSIHHAREPASLSQLVFYMWYLLENYATDPEIQSIVDNTELYFVPVVNPDGYLYNERTDPNGGGFWRKNRKNSHGVDNNRNYDYYINGDSNNGSWGGPGSSSNTGSETHHGSGPFSEVENQAIKWFVEQHNFVLALNNHSFGELVYFPFGYADLDTPDHGLYQSITAELTSQNGYNAFRDFPFSGDSDDFMYGTVGTHSKIYAMTPEIGTSFWPASNQIVGICQNMMYLNLTAANLAGNFGKIDDTSASFVNSTATNAEYSLVRLGLEEPSNFTVTINPVTSNILSVGSPNNHNSLTFMQEVNGTIDINLDSGISSGDLITYELVLNNGLYNKTVSVSKIYGQPTVVLDELGDNTNTNWTTSGWSSTTEDFVSVSSSITDSPNTNYSDNENSAITLTNEIDLNGALAASLTFQAKWDIENNWDYVQIEVSTNNGGNWIPQCGLYTNSGVGNQNGATNEPLYDGLQNDWVEESIDLSDYLNESILIRFRLVSDNTQTRDGFYFDDLQINVLEDNLGIDDVVGRHFNVFPNPVHNILNINTLIQDYDMKVYSIQGQLLLDKRSNYGNANIDYSTFSAGVYILNIASENGSQSFRIIKQ